MFQYSDQRREALTILQEELAEAIQSVSKLLRHGPYSTHPDGSETNQHALQRELHQVLVMMKLCNVLGLFDQSYPGFAAEAAKLASLHAYSGLDPFVLNQVQIG